MLVISLTIACSCFIYNGFILHAHPVRSESHNQRNTTGEVATVHTIHRLTEISLTFSCTLCDKYDACWVLSVVDSGDSTVFIAYNF